MTHLVEEASNEVLGVTVARGGEGGEGGAVLTAPTHEGKQFEEERNDGLVNGEKMGGGVLIVGRRGGRTPTHLRASEEGRAALWRG